MSEIPETGERRHSPRHKIKLAVDLVLENGTILPATSRFISGTGIQVFCDSWVTDEIEPRGIQVHSVSHIKLKTVAELPVNHTHNKLYAHCKIVSVQRLSQNEFALNLAFTGFENGTEQVLDSFLSLYQQRKIRVETIDLTDY